MPQDFAPAQFEKALKKGQAGPCYLLHGPNEFLMERMLDRLKEMLVPEAARAFNLEIFYGGESKPSDIMAQARSMPFLSSRRLVIVRRTEGFGAEALGQFLPYIENPAESTCLVFLCTKADFKKDFFKSLRASGRAVHFEDIRESQVAGWIRETAAEMGLTLDLQSCQYLQQVTGNEPRDLYGELEKIHLRYGKGKIDPEGVRDTVASTRSFTVFELMKLISNRSCGPALAAMSRFLEEEDKKSGPLRLLGMLSRQLRLLCQTREVMDRGGRKADVEAILGRARYSADEYLTASKKWSLEELKKAISLLYEADGHLKNGSAAKLVLENVVLRLCSQGGLR